MCRSFRLSLVVTAALAAALPAEAAQRAYVASTGNDANVGAGCTLALPCRSFTGAHTAVDAGGEIVALDAAGYGAVTITKSVTITANPGFFAGIAASTGNAVTIATPSVNVILRNLSINGVGATNGVVMSDGSRLSIENCVISNFSTTSGRGISVSNPANVRILDTLVRENWHGLHLSAGAKATVGRSSFLGNQDVGIYIPNTTATSTTAHVSDTIVATNFNQGIGVRNSNAGGLAKVWAIRTTVANNAYGISAEAFGGPAVIHIGASMIVDNSNAGYYANGTAGAIETTANNIIDGNAGNTGTLTYIVPQ